MADPAGAIWAASNPHRWAPTDAWMRSTSPCPRPPPSCCAGKAMIENGAKSAVAASLMTDGRARAVVDAVMPVVDGGRFRAKCTAGEPVRIEAHCFTDGHDRIAVALRWQAVDESDTYEVDMTAQVNDVWTAQFTPPVAGRYRYTVSAWVDHFESWRRELERRNELGDIRIALKVGAGLIADAVTRAAPEDAATLAGWAAQLRATA